VLEILDKKFGTSVNSKGYKVLPPYIGVIQGDGVNQDSIDDILNRMKNAGWSAENAIFGSGGALLQQLDRDISKFALKCSMAIVNGKTVEVFKDPITDSGKRSKKGEITLITDLDGNFKTVKVNEIPPECSTVFDVVYKDGELIREMSFGEIRTNSELSYSSSNA